MEKRTSYSVCELELSQLPPGTDLKWNLLRTGNTYPPVTAARQQAVFEHMRATAAEHGVRIE